MTGGEPKTSLPASEWLLGLTGAGNVFTTNFVYLANFMSVKILMRHHVLGFRECHECSFNYKFRIITLQFTFYEARREKK